MPRLDILSQLCQTSQAPSHSIININKDFHLYFERSYSQGDHKSRARTGPVHISNLWASLGHRSHMVAALRFINDCHLHIADKLLQGFGALTHGSQAQSLFSLVKCSKWTIGEISHVVDRNLHVAQFVKGAPGWPVFVTNPWALQFIILLNWILSSTAMVARQTVELTKPRKNNLESALPCIWLFDAVLCLIMLHWQWQCCARFYFIPDNLVSLFLEASALRPLIYFNGIKWSPGYEWGSAFFSHSYNVLTRPASLICTFSKLFDVLTRPVAKMSVILRPRVQSPPVK